jgi:alanine-synthesizing transaminase
MKRLYSARLTWNAAPNRLAQARTRITPRFDLTISNPTAAGFDYPDLPPVDARSTRYRPEPFGLLESREAVSEYYRGRGCDVPPSRICLTASTSEAYSWLFKLFCDPGDAVLVPRPSYPLFEYLAALEGVAVESYPLFYDGAWTSSPLNPTPRTRAVVAVSPNNPTGSLTDLEPLLETGLPLIVDEVFADYAPPVPLRDDIFYLNGLSKTAGLPQIKVGWIVFPAGHEEAIELIADSYLSVNTPAQWALPELLRNAPLVRGQIRSRCETNYRHLARRLTGTAIQPFRIDGGWTLPVAVPRIEPEEDLALRLLEQEGVLVQPGFFYDFDQEGILVLSLLTPPETFAAGLERILEAIC